MTEKHEIIPIARPSIASEEIKAVERVMREGILARGEEVELFEEEFKDFLGMPYAVATSSGTAALMTTMSALSLPPGTKVITTSYSFIASTSGIIHVNAVPLFADVDPETCNISPKSIRRIIKDNPDVKALLIVHLYGQSCNMDEILQIVKEYNLILIEDCAQSHGATWKGKKVGTFGDASIFSFYPTKNMTTGEGGMCLFKDQEVYEKAKRYKTHGCNQLYYHKEHGYNFEMTNMAGAIGRIQLQKLPMFNLLRARNAAFYDKEINNPIVGKFVMNSNASSVFNQYNLLLPEEKRDDFMVYMRKYGINARIYYPLTIPEQECFSNCGFYSQTEQADILKKRIVAIPVFPGLSNEDLEHIVLTINGYER